MKIREGFILRDVAGKTFVVATGELSKSFKGMITLNETGKFIWKLLENGAEKEEIVEAIMKDYDVQDRALVENDVNAFIDKLAGDNILE
ncbi:MAG: PqqD family protein [Clostridia bacterium]|nr:PqqD family protein [Clostridia bacterium]